MVNNLIEGISMKLTQIFGEGISVYSENVEQGLQAPCFFIAALNPSQKNLIGNRSLRQYPFDIRYYPAVQGSNNENQGTASNLYDALEYIQFINGDFIQGSKMRHEVVEGILHFYINFNMFVNKVIPEEECMTVLKYGTDLEG